VSDLHELASATTAINQELQPLTNERQQPRLLTVLPKRELKCVRYLESVQETSHIEVTSLFRTKDFTRPQSVNVQCEPISM
jgi:hypothetical protein